jgi:hypothetical protein
MQVRWSLTDLGLKYKTYAKSGNLLTSSELTLRPSNQTKNHLISSQINKSYLPTQQLKMLFKPLLIPLFLTSTLALPTTITDLTNSTTATTASANGINMWQAAGGCKLDWSKNDRCFRTCGAEGPEKCPHYVELTSVIQGGCLFWWRTCTCVCYHAGV